MFVKLLYFYLEVTFDVGLPVEKLLLLPVVDISVVAPVQMLLSLTGFAQVRHLFEAKLLKIIAAPLKYFAQIK